MGKRGHVFGSEPPKDPMQEVRSPSVTITSDTEVRWNDRKVKWRWEVPVAVTVVAFYCVFYLPIPTIISIAIAILLFFSVPLLSKGREKGSLESGHWANIPEFDISCTVQKKHTECRGIGGIRSLTGLTLSTMGSTIPSDMAKFVRGVPPEHGLYLTVSLRPQNPKRIITQDTITSGMDYYLDNLSKDRLEGYMDKRGGLWKTNLMVIGQTKTVNELRAFKSAVQGVLPSREWKTIAPGRIASLVSNLNLEFPHSQFYATGRELSDWLVQVRTELAGDVGSNIPGQFVAPVRSRGDDYRLGVVLNPDTLQAGPEVGLSHSDLRHGLVLCGGVWIERRYVMQLLVKGLLEAGKRVLLVSSQKEASDLTSLTTEGVSLELGKDLVLNPIDPEGVPRTMYVSRFIEALEILAASPLSAASDLQAAIGNAVALGSSTVADVTFGTGDDAMTDTSEAMRTPELNPSSSSMKGMDAIRTLHQGAGARAFYGQQTVSLERLSKLPLSIVTISLGSTPLDMFAWDILCLKLEGVIGDKDLVVILDEPRNLMISSSAFKKRIPWTERLVRELTKSFSLVLSIEQVSEFAYGVTNPSSACIALRPTGAADIKRVTQILKLTTIEGGLHSRRRKSARETSFFSILKDGMALMVHDGSETPFPIRLDTPSQLQPVESAELDRRVGAIKEPSPLLFDKTRGTLVDRVGGGDRELVRKILNLLKRYEPLTEEAIRKFLTSTGMKDADVEGVMTRLEGTNIVLRGHEVHSGVSYKNYRMTMKGTMTLRQMEAEV